MRQLVVYSQVLRRVLDWAAKERQQGMIICYNTLLPHTIVALIAKWRYGVKVVPIAITRPYDFLTGRQRFSHKISSWVSGKLLLWVDGLVAITEPLAKLLLPCKPYCIISGGIRSEQILPSSGKTPPQSPHAGLTVCYTGTLYARYHINNVLEAFSHLPEHNLQIYGAGPLRNKVQDYAKKYKNISYYGLVDDLQLKRAQSEADVLLAMLDTEDDLALFSFPSKIYEYMARGQVILASKLMTYPLEMQNLLEFSDTSSPAIEEAIKRIAKIDPVTRAKKASAMRHYMATQATWEQIGLQLVIFLNTLRT